MDACYCDMFSVVNVYLHHLKFCVVCINGRRYVCCGECYECDEFTSCLVQPIVVHCCEVMGVLALGVSLRVCPINHKYDGVSVFGWAGKSKK